MLGWVDLGIAMDDNFSGSLFPKDLRIAIWNMFRRYSLLIWARSQPAALLFSACMMGSHSVNAMISGTKRQMGLSTMQLMNSLRASMYSLVRIVKILLSLTGFLLRYHYTVAYC